MDDDFIIAAYITLADTMQELEHPSHRLSKVSGAEVLTVALSEFFALKRYRHGVETVNSQLQNMGAQHLKARTNQGFFVKVHAFLLAIICTNLG